MHYQIGNLQISINPSASFLLTMNSFSKLKNNLPTNILSAIKYISVEKIKIKSIIKPYLMLAGLKLSYK